MIRFWLADKFDDFKYWLRDRPFKKLWHGFRDRVDAVIFCLMLLIVGIYSPRTLRRIMVDALNERKLK